MSVLGMARRLHIPFQVDTIIDNHEYTWDGNVTKITFCGSHIEFDVDSSSIFTAIAVGYSTGLFLTIPRFGVGFALGHPGDVMHGVNKVFERGTDCVADSITAVFALAAVYHQGMFTSVSDTD